MKLAATKNQNPRNIAVSKTYTSISQHLWIKSHKIVFFGCDLWSRSDHPLARRTLGLTETHWVCIKLQQMLLWVSSVCLYEWLIPSCSLLNIFAVTCSFDSKWERLRRGMTFMVKLCHYCSIKARSLWSCRCCHHVIVTSSWDFGKYNLLLVMWRDQPHGEILLDNVCAAFLAELRKLCY